jgi:hypothetical protein
VLAPVVFCGCAARACPATCRADGALKCGWRWHLRAEAAHDVLDVATLRLDDVGVRAVRVGVGPDKQYAERLLLLWLLLLLLLLRVWLLRALLLSGAVADRICE